MRTARRELALSAAATRRVRFALSSLRPTTSFLTTGRSFRNASAASTAGRANRVRDLLDPRAKRRPAHCDDELDVRPGVGDARLGDGGRDVRACIDGRIEDEPAAVDDDRKRPGERRLNRGDGLCRGQPPHADARDRHARRHRRRTRRPRGGGGRGSRGRRRRSRHRCRRRGDRRRDRGRDVGDHRARERSGGCESEQEQTSCKQALHGVRSVARAIPGSSETIASTPSSSRRRTASGSFAVQARTGTPRRWATRTADREQSVWCRASVSARAELSSSGSRAGNDRAQRRSPGTGHDPRPAQL